MQTHSLVFHSCVTTAWLEGVREVYLGLALNNHPVQAHFEVEQVAILRRLWTALLRIHYVLYLL